MICRVWHPDDGDETGAREIEAHSCSEAAQDFAERYDRDDWYDSEIRTYHVRDVDECLWSVDVQLETVVAYRTRELMRVAKGKS